MSNYGAPGGYGSSYNQQSYQGGQGQLPHHQPAHGSTGYAPQQSGYPAQQAYGQAPPAQYGAPYGQQQPQQQYGGPPQSQYGAPQSYGGQPAAQSYGAQSGGRSRQELQGYFQAVDQDRSGNINALELQAALVNGDFSSFDPSTVGMLIRMFDSDGTSTINLDEFAQLWQYIEQWQGIFRRADVDRSGTIQPRELENALRELGYPLSPTTITTLTRKYAHKGAQRGPGGFMATQGGCTFDNFIACAVSVKSLTETFQRYDPGRTGQATLRYEDFVSAALSCP